MIGSPSVITLAVTRHEQWAADWGGFCLERALEPLDVVRKYHTVKLQFAVLLGSDLSQRSHPAARQILLQHVPGINMCHYVKLFVTGVL